MEKGKKQQQVKPVKKQVQPAPAEQIQLPKKTLNQILADLQVQFLNGKQDAGVPIKYKEYDPYCKEKQFNVIYCGILFSVINPVEDFAGDSKEKAAAPNPQEP